MDKEGTMNIEPAIHSIARKFNTGDWNERNRQLDALHSVHCAAESAHNCLRGDPNADSIKMASEYLYELEKALFQLDLHAELH